ncbi:MAG TPA: OmpA family protein [Terriglobia bacterium]|nr:OmpA family protein [Terriglobia bacterium]
MKIGILLTLAIGLSLTASAQSSLQTTPNELEARKHSFRVNVISRDVQAVNYRHRGGSTKVGFAGTDLMPTANGEAKVESRRGAIEIQAEFDNLTKPISYGNEYLTYILWAISPEGRAVNLGEVLVGDHGRSKLDVTTDFQAFAMVVTAEPYYAVRQPSNLVVLENVVREDTKGTAEAVKVKYELMERGGYIPTGYKFDPVVLNARLPLEFFEARNALRIAESEGARQYASESYQHADQLMNTADGYATQRDVPRKQLIAVAREAVQTAEDAREIAVKKMGEEHIANERQASADAQALSRDQANEARRQKDKAQSEAAEDAARAKSELAESQAASAAAIAASQADAEKARLAAKAENEQARQDASDQSEQEKQDLRNKLSAQLNLILETRDSARGLIINISDVLFDTGKYTLKPGAREKLAKVSGIILAYPSLNLQVEGNTDSVGTEESNMKLSENRANAVRDYLVGQGLNSSSVEARGLGQSQPVATNDTAAGRQQNRRVELVVSGDAIGTRMHPVASGAKLQQ